MRRIVSDETLDILFRATSNHRAWLDRPVSDTMLRALWDLVRLAPTSGACAPVRVVFVRSGAAKIGLADALPVAERPMLNEAPAAAIVACPANRDIEPAPPAETALREGPLRAAYLMLAARALGLDCAPIWQFDARLVDAAVFPDGGITANFLCALGYREDGQVSACEALPGSAEACAIL
jgi:3-hydroxypropanoate dehydrogenase